MLVPLLLKLLSIERNHIRCVWDSSKLRDTSFMELNDRLCSNSALIKEDCCTCTSDINIATVNHICLYVLFSAIHFPLPGASHIQEHFPPFYGVCVILFLEGGGAALIKLLSQAFKAFHLINFPFLADCLLSFPPVLLLLLSSVIIFMLTALVNLIVAAYLHPSHSLSARLFTVFTVLLKILV